MSSVLVISLPQRTDRRQAMRDRLAAVGLDFAFLDAVDGRKVYPDYPSRRLRSHFGCFDSHINALTQLRDCGQDFGYVLEDDALIDTDITRLPLPADGDIFYFGGHGERREMPGDWDIALNILTTHAYAVRVENIPRLIAFLSEKRWKIDVRMAAYQAVHTCYISSAVNIKQADGFSDIANRRTQYDQEMAESLSRRGVNS